MRDRWSKVYFEWEGYNYQRNSGVLLRLFLPIPFFEWLSNNASADVSLIKFIYFKVIFGTTSIQKQATDVISSWLNSCCVYDENHSEIVASLRYSGNKDDRYEKEGDNLDILKSFSDDESIIALLKTIKLKYNEGMYSDRERKTEGAPSYLARVYADEIKNGALTYSKLRIIDRSLWDALRRWGKVEGNSISSLLDIGRTTRGRIPITLDDQQLDAGNPVHELAMKQVRQLELNRARVRRHREAKLCPK